MQRIDIFFSFWQLWALNNDKPFNIFSQLYDSIESEMKNKLKGGNLLLIAVYNVAPESLGRSSSATVPLDWLDCLEISWADRSHVCNVETQSKGPVAWWKPRDSVSTLQVAINSNF